MASVPPFINLKVRTPYSLAEGALLIKQAIDLAQKNNIPAMGVCDSNNLFGALEYSELAAKAGIQPIIGCAVHIATPQQNGRPIAPYKLFLYAQNEQGYKNLMALMEQSYVQQEEPALDMAALDNRCEHLLCITGGIHTQLGQLLLGNAHNPAAQHLSQLERLFAHRLYLEIPRHDIAAEQQLEPLLLKLAQERNLPILAVNDTFFAEHDQWPAHEVLMGIADGMTRNNPHRRRSSPAYAFPTPQAMQQRYADLPEALENTIIFAQRCAFKASTCAPILPAFTSELGGEFATLKAEATAGLDARLKQYVLPNVAQAEHEATRKKYHDRLTYELGIIEGMGFPGYFLIVSDFIRWAKDHGIPVGPGRGSGAGSIVAWALLITDLDPLEYDLLFERFLNPERVSMPDFDVDFCQDRRDEVIRYVQEKYGHDRVAQIITFGKLQARAALRDVGRVLELPYGLVDKICKLVPNNPANPVTLGEALESEEQLRAYTKEDETAELINTALALEGLYRHASTHAAGVVIGDRPLQELVPLYRDPRSDMPVTQFNMKWAESAGLVKFDFLGLKTLSVLQTAVRMIKERTGEEIDLLKIPMDDKPSFALLSRGETAGVFQLESAGMRDVLKKLQPDRFEDIIALVALYRPGPMDNIPIYNACKHGQQQPDYLHPKLEPILKETFGVMIYQEQVMQAAQLLAGYSLGGADLLRRAMGKKIKAEMDAQRKTFVDGAVANGVVKAQASLIFDQIAKFAGYGFNKSHAAAYALIAYQTAWLKANYPVEFMAATMDYDMQNTDKLAMFIGELKKLGIPLLAPDINHSDVSFKVELHDDILSIRYALAALKGVGEAAVEPLVAERAHGAYTSLFDMTQRLAGKGMNKRTLESLVQAGALDSLHGSRAATFENVEVALRHSNARTDEGQDSLFADDALASAAPQFIDKAEWPVVEKLSREQNVVGFYLSAHPLDQYASILANLDITPASDLMQKIEAGETKFTLAGLATARRERTSAKGNRFAFVQLSDQTASYEVTFWSEMLLPNRALLDSAQPLLITVDASSSQDSVRLTALRVQSLDQAAARQTSAMTIPIHHVETVATVQEIVATLPPGRSEITLKLPGLTMTLPGGFTIPAQQQAALRQLCG